jgi:hypothetical protein
MTHSQTHDEELPFHADFTARVMAEADAVATRRRKTRFVAGAVSMALLIGAVSFGMSQMWLRTSPAPQRVPTMIAATDLEPFAPRDPTTLLDIMFPHAAAVAEFYDQYGDSDADALEDDAVFFPEAKGVAATDS